MIKAVLFDMDGVLIDSYEAWFQLFNFTLKSYGLKGISKEEFDKKVWAQDFPIVTKCFFKDKDVEEISKFYFSNFMNFTKYLKKMENIESVLKELGKKGIKTVVVTNTYNEIAVELLKAVGIYKYFDLVIGGDDVEKGKPEPDILLKAIGLLNVGKEEVLFVGDTEWDRMAASKAKVKFVGFRMDSDERIDDLKELI